MSHRIALPHRLFTATGILLLASCASTAGSQGDAPKVTVNNYVRAESDYQFRTYIRSFDCFGKMVHSREPYDVHNQITVRGNRDTLYSFGIYDLTWPVTVTLPPPKGRYQSLMTISEDHSIEAYYGPQTVVLTKEKIGTRYALVLMRTFMDPNDPADVDAAHLLQDQLTTAQAEVGSFDVPSWDQGQIAEMRRTISAVGAIATESARMFGQKSDLDPAYHLFGAALGWGGLPAADSTYEILFAEPNDADTPYTLSVKDVPVDAFWSVTLYDGEGWLPVNDFNAYSYNNVTAEKDADGSVTIHFGGDPEQSNYLPIVDGWNYIVRLYRPRQEILTGGWTFPKPQAVK